MTAAGEFELSVGQVNQPEPLPEAPGPGWQLRLEPGTASSPLADELMLDTSPLTGAAQRDLGHGVNRVLCSPLGTFSSA